VVRASGGQSRLTGMFTDLWLSGHGDSTYDVRLDVNRKYVTAYKVVAGEGTDLPVMEQQIAQRVRSSSGHTQLLIPLFQVPVEAYGTVRRSLNDLREQTHTLELAETDWEHATHVKITPLASRRVPVTASVDSNNVSEANQIFLRSRVDGALMTRSAVERDLQVRVA